MATVRSQVSQRKQSPLRTGWLAVGEPHAGHPCVVFIHGNCSSAEFFRNSLEVLPPGYFGIAPDLRGFGASDAPPLDATRGLRDFADDVVALLDQVVPGQKVHLVGHSVGGGVALQIAIDQPHRVLTLTLEDPVSPFGFSGTRDDQGTPCWPDFAGSGGGTANAEFAKRLKEKDRGDSSDFCPRKVMNAYYFKPPFRSPDEERLVDSVLTTVVSDANYPGDIRTSANWPGVAPGLTGMNNAFSPKYLNLTPFADISPQPPVLWIRGDSDQIVSDTSLFDLGFLGKVGAIPGWPGDALFPPQPMVGQTRAMLERYKARGGRYQEVVLEDCGHSPHLEKPEAFHSRLFSFLADHPVS